MNSNAVVASCVLAGTRSLTHLAGSQLKAERSAVDPADVPRFFGSAQDIVRLALHTANDACLVQRYVVLPFVLLSGRETMYK